MANRVVKTVFLSAMILVASAVATYAQEPEGDSGQPTDPIMDEAFASGSLDFKVFGKYARNDEYYAGITQRFERNDGTLSLSDFLILYYGNVYRDDYAGGLGSLDWNELIRQGRDEEAYSKVKEALKTAPAMPNYLETALGLATRIGRPRKEITNLAWRLNSTLLIINALGDGTAQLPWIVTSVPDEYTLMRNMLGIKQIKAQSVKINDNGQTCDVIEIEPIETELFSGSELWFDVSFPFVMFASPRHWAKRLTGEDVSTEQSPTE
jgi:hypothetical protein